MKTVDAAREEHDERTQDTDPRDTGAVLHFDIREAEGGSGEPKLLMIGLPMGAEGFTTLAGHFPDRAIVPHDPRGVGRRP
jgi:hypothetical protein